MSTHPNAMLTGRTRYRMKCRLFGKPLVVLQVEERHAGRIEDEHGTGPDFDYTEWRDATPEDITLKESNDPKHRGRKRLCND